MKLLRNIALCSFVLWSCQKVDLPEPQPLPAADESTFMAEMILGGEVKSFSVGHDAFLVKPAYEIAGDLLFYESSLEKSPECSDFCSESLLIRIADENSGQNDQDPILNLSTQTYDYLEPESFENLITFKSKIVHNYSSSFNSSFSVNPFFPIQGIPAVYEEIRREKELGDYPISASSSHYNGDYQVICNGFITLFEQAPSAEVDIDIQPHYPDSFLATITASSSEGAIVASGQWYQDGDELDVSEAWNESFVVNLDCSVQDFELVTTNSNNSVVNVTNLVLTHDAYTKAIHYCYAGVSHEYGLEVITPDPKYTAEIVYTNPEGKVFSSSRVFQEDGIFEIIKAGDFMTENLENVMKLELVFEAVLQSEDGDQVTIQNGQATMAFGHPPF